MEPGSALRFTCRTLKESTGTLYRSAGWEKHCCKSAYFVQNTSNNYDLGTYCDEDCIEKPLNERHEPATSYSRWNSRHTVTIAMGTQLRYCMHMVSISYNSTAKWGTSLKAKIWTRQKRLKGIKTTKSSAFRKPPEDKVASNISATKRQPNSSPFI